MNEFFGDLISISIFSQKKEFPFEMGYSIIV